jgi:hypothetical protein
VNGYKESVVLDTLYGLIGIPIALGIPAFLFGHYVFFAGIKAAADFFL